MPLIPDPSSSGRSSGGSSSSSGCSRGGRGVCKNDQGDLFTILFLNKIRKSIIFIIDIIDIVFQKTQ